MASVLHSINWIVLVYFLALNLVYTLLLAVSYSEVRRQGRRLVFGGYDAVLRSPLTLPVSVLVPAYNEAETIVEAVNALRLLHYGEFEIVVIDDGSKDETLERLIEAFDLTEVHRPMRRSVPCAPLRATYFSRSVDCLTVVSKENGGKADALNAGINAARYPLFCSIDADAVLERDALLHVVKPFMERPQETVATSGIVRVANGCTIVDGHVVDARAPRSRLAMMQSVEYLRAFLGNRAGWSRLGALFVISGAFGVFKKQEVIAVGGYRTDTVGEDMELVLRLHRHLREQGRRYRIVFIPDPVVWTEVPEDLRQLRRQRNRWHRGLLECLEGHRKMIGNPTFGPLGLFGLPYNLLFEVLGPLIEVTGYVTFAVAIVAGAVDASFVVLFLLLAVGYGVLLSIGAILLDQDDDARPRDTRELLRLLLYALVENFGYRQLQALWRVQATFDFVRGKKDWGEMRRKGFATVADGDQEQAKA